MRLIDELRWRALWAGGRGSGVYEHQHKFNDLERLNKLRLKEVSLRKLGLHKEANLFREKVQQLSKLLSPSPAPPPPPPPPPPVVNGVHPDVARMREMVKQPGFRPHGNSPTTYVRDRFPGAGSIRDFINIKNTGEWKHFEPVDDLDEDYMYRSTGVGYDSLRKHLRV